jgi:hypothetical protein
MQVLKQRLASNELMILRSLNPRMIMSEKDKIHYLNLEKGYEGEVMFDKLTDGLPNNMFVINDLCLEYNNSKFQIDKTVIAQEKVFPFEVKNLEGNYYYDSGNFFTLSKKEILNPLEQANRAKILLRKMLQDLGCQMPIESNVVFVNPGFTLYQSPLNAAIIYPTQLNHFLKKFNQIPSKLNARHKMLAEQLISLHQEGIFYKNLPPYEFNKLKKGVICPFCFWFMYSVNGRKFVCEKCGCEESADSAIKRSVEELKLLFPDMKITTNLVHEWCGVIESKKMVRRILKENYRLEGYGRRSYFL